MEGTNFSNWHSQQFQDKIPSLSFEQFSQLLSRMAAVLRFTWSRILRDNKLCNRRYCLYTQLRRIFQEQFGSDKSVDFLCSIVLADVEEVYLEPFGSSSRMSSITSGYGSKQGVELLGLHKLDEAISAVTKEVKNLSADELRVLGLYKGADQKIRNVFGREFMECDAEHMICKVYIILVSRHPSRLLSLPSPGRAHAHPLVDGRDFWPTITCKVFEDMVSAFIALVESKQWPTLPRIYCAGFMFPGESQAQDQGQRLKGDEKR